MVTHKPGAERRHILFARAVNLPLPEEDNPDSRKYRDEKKFDDTIKEEILDRVKLYVDALHFLSGDTAYVPFASIHKYDIYRADSRRDAGLALAVIGGAAFIALMVAIAVAIANYEPTPTRSCPYIYTYSGDSCRFEGEIFGGAIFRSLERDDYLALHRDDVFQNGCYKVKMANMLQEVQYINQAELILVDHDTNVRILLDKYGHVQSVGEAEAPHSAFDSRNNDILSKIYKSDQETYNFNEEPDVSISYMNHIDLVFRSHSTPDSCKLLVKGHNSLWIDLLTTGIITSLGNKFPYWIGLMDRKSSEKQKEWVLSQGLPLQVYLLKGQKWQFADYFDIVGPIAAREMVLPLDVQDAWSEDLTGSSHQYQLSVRLVTGFNFWQVDYAAMDFTENVTFEKTVLPANIVTDQNGMDVTASLMEDDKRYIVQKQMGDKAFLNFVIPDNFSPSGSIFLHSKGYYHHIVGKSGKSELAFVWSFLKPGRLSEYSFECYLDLQDFLAVQE